MIRLRKIILGLLWFVTLVYGIAAFSTPLITYQMISHPAGDFDPDAIAEPSHKLFFYLIQLLVILILTSPVAICITSAGTVLQYHRRKQNTRSWALACGITFLVVSSFLIAGECFIAYYEVLHSGSVDYNGYPHSSLLDFPIFCLIHLAIGLLIVLAFKSPTSVSEIFSAEDRPAKVKGDGTTSVSYLLAFAVVIVALHFLDSHIYTWGMQHGLPQTSGFLRGQLILFGALYIAIAAHELGHIVAGLSVGMKLLAVRVGPFHMEIKDGRWRLISPASWKCLFQGGVRIIPPSPKDYKKSHAIWTGAGGPLANLAASGLALLALSSAKGSSYESAWKLLSYIAAICLVFFLANLIPVREASSYSDGAHIYQILSGNVMADFRRIAAMTVATRITAIRPRDFDISLIETTAANDALEPRIAAFLHLVACDYYFDREKMDEAGAALRGAEAAFEKMKSVWKENCESLILRAVCIAQNRTMAEKWWERRLHARFFDPKRKSDFDVIAFCIVENRLIEAEDAWKREFEHASRLPDTGERAFDLYYLSHLRRLLDEALTAGREGSILSATEQTGSVAAK